MKTQYELGKTFDSATLTLRHSTSSLPKLIHLDLPCLTSRVLAKFPRNSGGVNKAPYIVIAFI